MKPHPPVGGSQDTLPERPFRSAVLRGLGVLVPPLMTIVIFVWVGNTIEEYVLRPVTSGVREAILWSIADIRDNVHLADPKQTTALVDGTVYHRLSNDTFVPEVVYDKVRKSYGSRMPIPPTGDAIYRVYIDLTYLRPYYVVPFFLAVFVLLLYLLGKFMAAGMGRVFWNLFEPRRASLALGAECLLVGQAGDRFSVQRNEYPVHSRRGCRVSATWHLVARFRHGREPSGYSGRCE